MLTFEEIKARYKKLNLNEYEVPNDELRQRMLNAQWPAERNNLKEYKLLDKVFFEFCHTQVGPFGGATYNAIAISHLTEMPAIWIAVLINQYGVDWTEKAYRSLVAIRPYVEPQNLIDRAFGHIVTPVTLHHTMQFALSSLQLAVQEGTLKEYLGSRVKGAAGFSGTRYAALEPMHLGFRPLPAKEPKYTVKPPRRDLLEEPQEGDLI
jgi:hypothetical protein